MKQMFSYSTYSYKYDFKIQKCSKPTDIKSKMGLSGTEGDTCRAGDQRRKDNKAQQNNSIRFRPMQDPCLLNMV